MKALHLIFILILSASLHAEPILSTNQALTETECLESINGKFQACLNRKGALIITQNDPSKVIHEGGVENGRKGIYQGVVENGSFVIKQLIKKDKEVERWSTSTEGGGYLHLSDTGVLSLYKDGYLWDSSLWSSADNDEKKLLTENMVEPVTGILFEKSALLKQNLQPFHLLGVGVRVKSIVVTKVNVYAVGFYVDPKTAAKALSKFSKFSAADLINNDKFYLTLMKPGVFTRYLMLRFSREVSAAKVVDALSSVSGVSHATLKEFQSMLMNAIGKGIATGDSIYLGWEGNTKLVIFVRGKFVGSIEDRDLVGAIFELYLGKEPISPSAKVSIAEGVHQLLAK